jgi:gluconate 2-dehydrogenase subunit 3-like protein
MSDSRLALSRREVVAWLATLPLVPATLAAERALRAGVPYVPKFFTAHEWRTVRVLVDSIIPRDERSGSATDAGVPEFMDFIMTDRPAERTRMRGGLNWLDERCRDQFNAAFVDCAHGQQTAVLDQIAFADRAKPEVSQGVAFFAMFRDLTATGFWTSKMGIADLAYVGNTVVHEWKGCPEAALAKLGVSY